MFNPLNTRISILLLLMAALLACKQDASNSESTQAAVTFKRTKNEVLVRQEAEPDRMNPILTKSNYSRVVLEQLFQYLMAYDPYTLKLTPVLVEKAPDIEDISEGKYAGGATYTFVIKEEASWDNGDPITGHDYAFTLKAALNPLVNAPHFRAYLSQIKDVQVNPDRPKEFSVVVSQKDILGVEAITNALSVMPEHVYDKEDLLREIPVTTFTDPSAIEALADSDDRLADFAEQFSDPAFDRDPEAISGSGPYKLAEWRTGEQIILEKKVDWWGSSASMEDPLLAAGPDKITFTFISNPTTAVAALKSEDLDVMDNIPAIQYTDIKDQTLVTDYYNLHQPPPSFAYYYLAVNTRIPKLSETKVRQALAHAINVDEILESVYKGLGERLANPIAPSAPYYNDELKPIPYDIEKAKALLWEAGWEDTNDNGIVDKEINGKRTELTINLIVNNSSESSRNNAQLIKNYAEPAGINIELEGVEAGKSIERLRNRDFEMVSAGSTITPTWNPKQSWHTQGDNRTGFGNAATDSLIDEILVTLDEQPRNELYRQLQEIIYEEQHQILLFAPVRPLAIHRRFLAAPTAVLPNYQVNHFDLEM